MTAPYRMVGVPGALARRTASVSVPVETPPVANNDSYSLPEDSATTTFDVLANDLAGTAEIDTTTLTITQAPAHGSASVVSGTIRYTPTAGYFGADTIKYTVESFEGLVSNEATVAITVTEVVTSSADDQLGYGGQFFGCDGFCVNLLNQTMKSGSTIYVYSIRAQMTGSIKAVIAEMAANQDDGEAKSGGTGNIDVEFKVYDGKAPTANDDAGFPSRPDALKATVTSPHDRGSNGYNGDKRKGHRVDFTSFNITKGDFVHIAVRIPSANSTNFLSINGPARLNGGTSSPSVTAYFPDGASPPRRISPYWGDDGIYVLAKKSGVDGYRRVGAYMAPAVALVYDMGGGIELKHGPGYRQGDREIYGQSAANGSLLGQCHVGGPYRLRQRWKHTAESMEVRFVWVMCHYHPSYIPPGNLRMRVLEEASASLPARTWEASLGKLTATDGSDTSPAGVQAWGEKATGNFPGWSRFSFQAAGDLDIVKGRTYTAEFFADSAGGSNQQTYRLHGSDVIAMQSLSSGDAGFSKLNVWHENPNSAGQPARAERSVNGGTNWNNVVLFNSPVSLLVLFEKKV